jgi:carbon-monoxide dehydrogenase medium subunit
MYDFRYTRPTMLAEALQSAEEADSKFLAGGMTLLPACKQRLARPSTLIDLSGIRELAGISMLDGMLRIGAMTRHFEVAASEAVHTAIPGLARLAGVIGDQQVRHRGTIGGSVANNDPAADYPAGLLGLGATIATDRRTIAADDFFLGLFETALEEGEMLTSVSFSVPDAAAYVKFPSPASGYALIGVMVSRTGADVRVAVTGGGHGVFRVAPAEAALTDDWSPQAVSGIEVDADMLSDDHGAPAAYKMALIRTLIARAVASMAR